MSERETGKRERENCTMVLWGGGGEKEISESFVHNIVITIMIIIELMALMMF